MKNGPPQSEDGSLDPGRLAAEKEIRQGKALIDAAKEAEVKKDTKEQLDAFRKQREDAEKAAKQADDTEEPAAINTWAAAGTRKRKKGKEKENIGGLKMRRTLSQPQLLVTTLPRTDW